MEIHFSRMEKWVHKDMNLDWILKSSIAKLFKLKQSKLNPFRIQSTKTTIYKKRRIISDRIHKVIKWGEIEIKIDLKLQNKMSRKYFSKNKYLQIKEISFKDFLHKKIISTHQIIQIRYF